MTYPKSAAKAYARANMRGVWAAIPYPFDANGEIDEPETRRNVRYYIDQIKIDGIFCGGLVGECWALTMEERLRGQQIVISEVAGRIPVIAHAGAQSIRDTVRIAQHAQELGAPYVVVVNPPLNPHSSAQVKDFFRSVCAELDIGVSLFNAREAGWSLTPAQIADLCDIENIVSIKNPQDPEHLAQTRRLVGKEILVFDPSEARFLDNILQHGDQCYMSSPAPLLLQAPGQLTMREYSQLAWNGDAAGAKRVAATLDAKREVLRKWIFGPWLDGELPIPQIKACGELLGFYRGDRLRLPMRSLSAAQKAEFRADLEKAGWAVLKNAA